MEQAPNRRTLVLLVAPLVGFAILATVANALAPALLVHHPLLLISLSSRNRYLVGTASSIDVVPFVAVALVRRFIEDPLFFILGRRYGHAAVRWAEQRGGGGAFVRALERGFLRARYPVVFFFPGGLVCVLAGSTGMSVRTFLTLDVLGTLAVITLLRAFGFALSEPVDDMLHFLNRNIVWTTALSVVLVLSYMVVQRRRGHAEVETVEELVEEIEDAIEDEGASGG